MQFARIIKSFFRINKIKSVVEPIILEPEINPDREYLIGNFKIILRSSHVLDLYQNKYPLYDKFLPIICENLSGLIIDVGANIGDSSVFIFSKNTKSFIVGVEPDEEFSIECLLNINLNNLSNRFLLIKKFISTKSGKFIVEKNESKSTGSILLDLDNEFEDINTISFAEMMDLIPDNKKETFDMLKIDTDGFDWDILNSFSDYAKNSLLLPKYIFFEMQTFINNEGYNNLNREQISNDYLKSIEKIYKIGYTNFNIFDNFGTLIKTTKQINDIIEISDYIKNSQIHNNHSTIFHLDILAFKDADINEVELSIKKLFKNNK